MFDAFNNPKSGVQVLLITTKLGSASLNFHYSSSRLIVWELCPSLGIFIQALGRIVRIGQAKKTFIHWLWCDESYDQIMLHRVYSKYISSLAGEAAAVGASDNVSQVTEELLRVFLGMQHSAYPRVWGSVEYRRKTRYLTQKAKEAQDLECDSPNDPAVGASDPGSIHTPTPPNNTNPILSKLGKRARTRNPNTPRQNIPLG
jgi:hypothetical protein